MSSTHRLRVEDVPVFPDSNASDDSATRSETPPSAAYQGFLDPALARVLTRVRLRARRRVEWLRTVWRKRLPAPAIA